MKQQKRMSEVECAVQKCPVFGDIYQGQELPDTAAVVGAMPADHKEKRKGKEKQGRTMQKCKRSSKPTSPWPIPQESCVSIAEQLLVCLTQNRPANITAITIS